MRRTSLRVFLLASALTTGACASAPQKPQPPPVDLAKADALVAEGCYDCLTEARDLYAQAAAIPRLRYSTLPRLFETHILIGLRLKELSLDPAKPFAEARAIVPDLPATYAASTYLDVATAILPDSIGTPGRELSLIKRPGNAELEGWKASLGGGDGTAAFRAYLSIGLDCVVGRAVPPAVVNGGAASAPPVASSGTDPQLVVYRRATCPRSDRVVLGGIAEADPRFLEAGVLSGRVRSRSPNGKEIADAKAWMTSAHAKWPESTVVTYALGALYQTVGDCKAALGFYDKTLALKPLHEDAHFGRLVCLSYLRQHVPAVAEATGMIADKNNEAEATYWRAWNKRELTQLKEARVDSDRMKSILYHDRAMLLAGQIEYDLDDLDIAEKDLKDAARLNPLQCVAPWYLGLLQLKRQAWTPTAEAFVDAMDCYRFAVAYDREKLAEMQKAENIDESFRAAQIAGFETAIRDDSSQMSASAFNAAVNYARANNRPKALEYCDLAAKDPAREKQAAELRALIVK